MLPYTTIIFIFIIMLPTIYFYLLFSLLFLHWFFYVTCRVVHVVVYSCLIMCKYTMKLLLFYYSCMHAALLLLIMMMLKLKTPKKIMKQLMKERPEIKVPNQIAEALTHMVITYAHQRAEQRVGTLIGISTAF